jgi:nicotine blue oxidoreductase
MTAVVPAAGASRRFGGMKLVAAVGGEPLIQHTLHAILRGGAARVVVVVSPRHGLESVPVLGDRRVSVIVNVEPDRGMFSSIQMGLAGAATDKPVLILPADMPFVSPETVKLLIAEHVRGGDAVVAACGGRRGHPLILPAVVWRPLGDQPSDASLKSALIAVGATLRPVTVDDPGVLRDVDEPRDLEQG